MTAQDNSADDRDPIFQTELMRNVLDDVKCLGCYGGGVQVTMDGSNSDICAHCHGEGVDIDLMLVKLANYRSAPTLAPEEAREALRWEYAMSDMSSTPEITDATTTKLRAISQLAAS
jgi:hypothetical protein